MRAQMRPRASKRRLKGTQETPKSPQKLPKRAQDASQTGPEGSQTLPKTSPVSSQTHVGRDWHRKARLKGCRSNLLRFFALCALLAKCVATQ